MPLDGGVGGGYILRRVLGPSPEVCRRRPTPPWGTHGALCASCGSGE